MPKYETLPELYPHPFSAAYWRAAVRDLKDVRKLTFAALMIAMCVVLGHVPAIRLFGGARVTWGFLARAACAWVCGPVVGVVFAVAEDNLSFLLASTGDPYFPGYTLTTVLGVLTYSLFLYRAKPTVGRVLCAKVLTNVQNVLLGALWSAILAKKAWIYYASKSAVKNVVMLPVQVVLLVLLLAAVAPALARSGLIPPGAVPRRKAKRDANRD